MRREGRGERGEEERKRRKFRIVSKHIYMLQKKNKTYLL